MAKQLILTLAAVLSGDGDGYTPSSQLVNANAAPPYFFTLAAGANTIPMPPATFTVNGVWIKAPGASVNNKYFTSSGGTQSSDIWTAAPIAYPAAAAGNVYVHSVGGETVEIIPF